MNSCTNIIFKFPRTVNQITVSKNSYQFNMLCTVGNKPYPDKAVGTTDSRHGELMLMNAWLDSLFEASPSFIHSLNNNEVINGNLINLKLMELIICLMFLLRDLEEEFSLMD
jgi:hypothetical protein